MSPLWTFLPLGLALVFAATPWRFGGLSLSLGLAGLAWVALGGWVGLGDGALLTSTSSSWEP